MISSIAPHLEKLKFHAFGPKLYNKLISTYPKLTMLKDTQMNQKILNNHRQMNSISSNNLINVTDNNFNPYNRMMPTMSNAIINQMNCYATPMTNNNMFNNNVIYQNIPYDQYSNYPPNFNFPSYYHK